MYSNPRARVAQVITVIQDGLLDAADLTRQIAVEEDSAAAGLAVLRLLAALDQVHNAGLCLQRQTAAQP